MTDEEVTEIRERLVRLETKMNLIAYIATASYGTFALTLLTIVWMHI